VLRWADQRYRDHGAMDRKTMNEHHYVCVSNIHGVMESQRDPVLKIIHNQAVLVTADGMPLVWSSKSAGYKDVGRVYGLEIMLALGAHGEARGYHDFFYGATDDTLKKLNVNLCKSLIQIVGSHAPPFRPLTEEEDREVINQINDSGAQVVWVLSTPKQERWKAAHIGLVSANVLIGVGAAFDFHAGTVRQAPRWMQRGGLERFFRICMEPRRLWKRYAANIPLFLIRIVGPKAWHSKSNRQRI
jgi:N-acetylglucosaminyldiphosphoundecaprenol N-acetyl-beta-D-mannosaminyltransferase